MKKYRILFLVGRDRPGIAEDVSAFLFERGANIEDSRMAALGGRFSVMTLFSCTSERLDVITKELDRLTMLGFEASIHEAEDPNAIPRQPGLPLKLEVISMDHPGIVQKVVSILHRRNVNIQTLDTRVTKAPLSGASLFDLTLEADVPAGTSISTVKEELLQLAAEMNLDLNFLK
ncbi:MAG: ACT domain-containing protein [Candidatus Abyssobacteria bacterium SURF_17]|uniref:ACT domain-containing protein n=1 Tax=Candidatus Abyssobacteria bacterium SURF_17 TaxID=2093361 RepID=A0A419ESR4_9BACT|nr:MAG: ACT domain-containing protein [Candidatus Abyssubacteria bacterium SURF_17]